MSLILIPRPQLSQHSALVQQLHSADCESLLAEILALRATLESMRNEQRQQVQYRMTYVLHVHVYTVSLLSICTLKIVQCHSCN